MSSVVKYRSSPNENKFFLLVQCVNVRFAVLVDHPVGDDDRPPLVRRLDAIRGEAPGKTSGRAEKTFKCFRQVMGEIILVDLDHGPP